MGHGALAPAANPTFLERHVGTTPCQRDPELWVAVNDQGLARRRRARAAARRCHGCPLMLECRHWAVKNRQTGVWGGVDLQHGKPYTGAGG